MGFISGPRVSDSSFVLRAAGFFFSSGGDERRKGPLLLGCLLGSVVGAAAYLVVQ